MRLVLILLAFALSLAAPLAEAGETLVARSPSAPVGAHGGAHGPCFTFAYAEAGVGDEPVPHARVGAYREDVCYDMRCGQPAGGTFYTEREGRFAEAGTTDGDGDGVSDSPYMHGTREDAPRRSPCDPPEEE